MATNDPQWTAGGWQDFLHYSSDICDHVLRLKISSLFVPIFMITNIKTVVSETLFSLENEPTKASICIGPSRRRGGGTVGSRQSSVEYGALENGRTERGESG